MASSLGDFGNRMHQRAGQVNGEVVRAMKEVALSVVTNVAQDTPILTGQAQANWLLAFDKPNDFMRVVDDFGIADARDSIAYARGMLQKLTRSDTEIHITNNVPYIIKLNNGSSKQAPRLFVQAAVLRASYKLRAFKITWT